MGSGWQPGTKVGRYVIKGMLGSGGLGFVYRAEDAFLGRDVAIKTIRGDLFRAGEAERFAREARVLAALGHPSIVTIYDVGVDDGQCYIVTELVEGLSLAELAARGQVPLRRAVEIGSEMASALSAVHEAGIVHADIKPGNIMIDSSTGRAKLLDFGLARRVEPVEGRTRGSFAGTPAYSAPEAIDPRRVGIPSDIYSLGATIYHMLTGTYPHAGTELAQVLAERMRVPPEDPKNLRKDMPMRLRELLLKMLARAPEDRPQSMREVASEFDQIGDELGENQAKVSPESPEESLVPTEKPAEITRLGEVTPPPSFAEDVRVSRWEDITDGSARYRRAEESLRFYRDHLDGEYRSLLQQAGVTYGLWLACVVLAFLLLLGGGIAMLMGFVTQGALTAASAAIVYFIHRVFQQREDYYRGLAASKIKHLQYGNEWLLAIQTIDSIGDPEERAKRRARLVEVLTDRLRS